MIECGGRAKTNRPPLAVTNWLASWSLLRAGVGSVGDVPLKSHASVGAKFGALLPPPKQAPSRDTSCEHNSDTVNSEEEKRRHPDTAMAQNERKGCLASGHQATAMIHSAYTHRKEWLCEEFGVQ